MTWKERIAVAKEKGFFSKEDLQLSDSWTTDPIAEIMEKYPVVRWHLTNALGRPHNSDLRNFGFQFGDAVERDEPFLAEELLGLIERTIEKLVKEIS